jgi:hypothetical protein
VLCCAVLLGAKPEQEAAAGGTPGPSQAAAAADDDGGGDVDMLDLTQATQVTPAGDSQVPPGSEMRRSARAAATKRRSYKDDLDIDGES